MNRVIAPALEVAAVVISPRFGSRTLELNNPIDDAETRAFWLPSLLDELYRSERVLVGEAPTTTGKANAGEEDG